MTYSIKRGIYKDANGAVTAAPGQGESQNEVLFVPGAVVSLELAEELGLPALDADADKKAEEEAVDPFADLTPFKTPADAQTIPEAEPAKPTKKVDPVKSEEK